MVGNRIKQLREEKEISQKSLAEFINVSPSTVGMYEQGRRMPSTEILNLIATYFDVTSDYLLERTNNPHAQVSEDDYKMLKNTKDIINTFKKAGINPEHMDLDALEKVLRAYVLLNPIEKK
ncbi:helix-turn-helix transcriptional regulator [Clostridium sp.]|uniref:helix-turn-helix domain-containing protein n=1 Tax=Clostridium sp. TaxID=1506 RepID=UPI00284973E1|nr:helix-turn-helix transcriptional regulator [Clostridium sp.]MDR3593821.1 helix-turn-helix transcriptional regulator [Clostridium sp.]